MYDKEIVKAVCSSHLYEYCIVSRHFEVLKYSTNLSKYCDKNILSLDRIDLFSLVPELVGMEEDMMVIFDDSSEEIIIPTVFKIPNHYINIRVHPSKVFDVLIVLFENVTESTISQYTLKQISNENILLLEALEDKNKQLKVFNQEMQNLVKEEVSKNLEKQYMLELQTRHAQMGEMISLITHQWRQPLSLIQTLGTVLKMKYKLHTLTPELTMEKIENILKQADHMSQTVNDFQKFFTPSKHKDVFYVKETIQSVLDLVKMEYGLSNIEITLEGNATVTVNGYPNEYNQVILSLLQNAKDAFMEQNISKKYVHIRVAKKKDYSLVSIRDNAGGVPENLIKDIFTQYTTSKEHGSGLGLYIAKSVIENNMEGKIWVENTQEGAVFFIAL